MNSELKNLINGLSVDNFRTLVKEYAKQKYSTTNVRIIDGPYDGGNDLEIFVNDKEIKRNIQITVQKTQLAQKIKDDLEKAKNNSLKYSYLKKLDFYTSQNVPKEQRNIYETEAEIEYGIDLDIFDATTLTELSDTFNSIKKVTLEAYNLKYQDPSKGIDTESKILFDVLTSNKNTVEIKKNFIYSFIYSFLFTNPDSSIENIHSFINPKLNNGLDISYLSKELNFLKSKGFLTSLGGKNTFQLSSQKDKEIKQIYESTEIQEQLLIKEVSDFIIGKALSCQLNDLLDVLKNIFIENYQIDLGEIKNEGDSFSASLKRSFSDLSSFLTKNGIELEQAKKYSSELLEICSKNDYLNKISTTTLFTNLYNSDKLDSYINDRVQTVVLDTQILIRILCIYYKEDFDYKDMALNATQMFLTSIKANRDKIRLLTTYDYIEEVAGHFQEALKLQRFLNLPYIANFGVSKNVFYNVFLRYKQEREIEPDMNFEQFIEDLIGEDLENYNKVDFISNLCNRLIDLFELAGIEIVSHPLYSNYGNVKREYEMSLAFAGKERSYTALENDLRTILYLSTTENHISLSNGIINEPFLITWDSAFYGFRKKLLKTHKECNYWYIYSPLKFIDRLSVMNFKLMPHSISYNVIALAETNFNYSTKTTSFFDLISSFFNKKDVSKMSILKKLADLKKSTQDLDGVPEHEANMSDADESPITKVLLDLRSHYNSHEEKNKFSDLINVLEDETIVSEIYDIFNKAVLTYKKGRKNDDAFIAFNQLIEKKA
jgi:hypothetical protein